MKTEHLEYLLEVARTGSISAAAKNLFIGQTTLSAIINSVESELNVQIFSRSHRGVRLTERGEQVVALAEDIVEKSCHLMDLNFNKVTTKRNIPIIVYPCACNTIGLYLCKRMKEINGTPALSLYETQPDKIVSSVINGIANIGIGSSGHHEFFTHQNSAHNHNLKFVPLYTDRFCLCVNKDSCLSHRKSIDISELKDEVLAATCSHSSSDVASVRSIFKYVDRVFLYNNPEVIKRAVLAENMITVLPRLSFYNDPMLARGDIKLIEITGFETQLHNFVILNNHAAINSYELQVVHFIREFYESLPKV